MPVSPLYDLIITIQSNQQYKLIITIARLHLISLSDVAKRLWGERGVPAPIFNFQAPIFKVTLLYRFVDVALAKKN
jgi:hypothetical protein